MTERRPPTLNVLGYLGAGNLGDELMLRGLLELVWSVDDGAHIVVHRNHPLDWLDPRPTDQRVSYLPRYSIAAIRSSLRNPTVLCGGTNVHDAYSGRRHLRQFIAATLLVGRLVVARAGRQPVLGLSIGLGPLDRRSTRLLARCLLWTLTFLSVRSVQDAAAAAAQTGVRPPVQADLATAYLAGLLFDSSSPTRAGPLLVVPVRSPRSQSVYPSWEAVAEYARANGTNMIRVLPANRGGPHDDVSPCVELAEKLRMAGWETTVASPGNLEDLFSEFESASSAFVTRYHAVHVAAAVGVPHTVYPYHPKVEALISGPDALGDSQGVRHNCEAIGRALRRDQAADLGASGR